MMVVVLVLGRMRGWSFLGTLLRLLVSFVIHLMISISLFFIIVIR